MFFTLLCVALSKSEVPVVDVPVTEDVQEFTKIEGGSRTLSIPTSSPELIKYAKRLLEETSTPPTDFKVDRFENEDEGTALANGRRSFAIFFTDSTNLDSIDTKIADFTVFLSTDSAEAERLNCPFPGIYAYNVTQRLVYRLKVEKSFRDVFNVVQLPLIQVVTQSNYRLYEASELPTFYVMANEETFTELTNEFTGVARNYRNKALITLMHYQRGRTQIKSLGLTEEDLPAMIRIENNLKYVLKSCTAEKSNKFVADCVAGVEQPLFVSAVAPEDNEIRNVKVLVYNELKNVVGDASKDRLIVFHAPWCGYCKTLLPEVERLGEALAVEGGNVALYTMDLTENDHEGFSVNSFPTIYLVKANSNEKVLFESKERTAEALANFIKESGESGSDLSPYLPEKKSEEAGEEESEETEVSSEAEEELGETADVDERDEL